MKICFDYEIFWKQRFSGIASRYFYNLIKTLSNFDNLDVKVFSKYYLNERLDEFPKTNVLILFINQIINYQCFLLWATVIKFRRKLDILGHKSNINFTKKKLNVIQSFI